MTQFRARWRHVACIFSCSVLAFGPSACSSESQPLTPPAFELLVDDSDATGAPKDGRLSLTEAIRLASGDLGIADLDEVERSRVRGEPAAGKPALIRVVLGRGVRIDVAEPLPVLRHLDGTTIDGGGAILSASGDQTDGGAFTVASSRLTLRDFAFEHFGTVVGITPQGVRDLHDILLSRLDVVTSGIGILLLGRDANGSLGSLRNVTISDSTFSGVPGPYGDALNGIRVEGMTQAGSEAGDPVIDGVLITRNRFGAGLLEGVDIAGYTGIAALSSPPAGGEGVLRNITIADNVFEDCPDACVLGIGALAIGATLSNVTISGLRIVDNDMTNGTGVYLVAGYALGAGVTRDNRFRDVEIRGNRLRASEGRGCGGLALVGDYTDLSNGLGTGDRIENVVIADNDIEGCHRGVLIAGAGSSGTLATLMMDNAVSSARILDNRIRNTGIAIHVSGADIIDGRLLGNSPLTGTPGLAIMTGNEVRDIAIEGNTLSNNVHGVLVTGGSVRDANTNTVTMNSVRGVRLSGNHFSDNQTDCRIADDYVHGSLVPLVLGNKVEDASCP